MSSALWEPILMKYDYILVAFPAYLNVLPFMWP